MKSMRRSWRTLFGRCAIGFRGIWKRPPWPPGVGYLEAQDRRFSFAHAVTSPRRSHSARRTLFRIASALLASEADGITPYRLIGVGADLLVDGGETDLPTLFDDELGRLRRLEQTIDEIRGRLGDESVRRGRDLARSAAEVAPHAVPRERE